MVIGAVQCCASVRFEAKGVGQEKQIKFSSEMLVTLRIGPSFLFPPLSCGS
jgi:hypothetical protein